MASHFRNQTSIIDHQNRGDHPKRFILLCHTIVTTKRDDEQKVLHSYSVLPYGPLISILFLSLKASLRLLKCRTRTLRSHFDWIVKTSYFYNNEELCSFLFIVVQCSSGKSVSKDSKSRDRRMDSQRGVHYFSQRRCPPELQGRLGGGRHGCHPRQVSRLLHLHLASCKQYSWVSSNNGKYILKRWPHQKFLSLTTSWMSLIEKSKFFSRLLRKQSFQPFSVSLWRMQKQWPRQNTKWDLQT